MLFIKDYVLVHEDVYLQEVVVNAMYFSAKWQLFHYLNCDLYFDGSSYILHMLPKFIKFNKCVYIRMISYNSKKKVYIY
jgi:hypothetical protein